jgi:two-component system, cell cycle response regulator
LGLVVSLLLSAINWEHTSPTVFWVWGAATLLLATGLGFLAGATYGSRAEDRGVRKAVKQVSSLYALAVESLEKAQRVAGLLEKFPQVTLTPEQVDRLESRRGSLLETIGRIIGTQRELFAKRIEKEPKAKPRPAHVEWDRPSTDAGTGLPDRAAFDANLRRLLDPEMGFENPGGLLLVKIDRIDHLRSRFGIQGADAFIKTMATVVARAVREADLVCRFGPDAFAVIFPSVDGDAGRKLSEAVRTLVRRHTFRASDGGPEVLVTASFGYTNCCPHDDPEQTVTRAEDALAHSARRGRNQLHACDGGAVVLCTAG